MKITEIAKQIKQQLKSSQKEDYGEWLDPNLKISVRGVKATHFEEIRVEIYGFKSQGPFQIFSDEWMNWIHSAKDTLILPSESDKIYKESLEEIAVIHHYTPRAFSELSKINRIVEIYFNEDLTSKISDEGQKEIPRFNGAKFSDELRTKCWDTFLSNKNSKMYSEEDKTIIPACLIFSPFGNGSMYLGKWNKTYSPQEMIVSSKNGENPEDEDVFVSKTVFSTNGFLRLTDNQLQKLITKFGAEVPKTPGEWAVIKEDFDVVLQEIEHIPTEVSEKKPSNGKNTIQSQPGVLPGDFKNNDLLEAAKYAVRWLMGGLTESDVAKLVSTGDDAVKVLNRAINNYRPSQGVEYRESSVNNSEQVQVDELKKEIQYLKKQVAHHFKQLKQNNDQAKFLLDEMKGETKWL
jgi:hypothetical protein